MLDDLGLKTLTGDEWITIDTHFSHRRVIEYCNRPFYNTQEMDEILIYNWNQVVGEHDTVFFLGDFAFKGTNIKTSILDRLFGNLILVKGNHDSGRQTMVNCGFDEAYLMIQGTIWDGRTYIMTHIPLYGKEKAADIMLCGHVHDRWTFSAPNHYNVGCDQWDFQPQRVRTVLEQAKERQAKLPVQNTIGGVWTPRDDKLVDAMYETIAPKHPKAVKNPQ